MLEVDNAIALPQRKEVDIVALDDALKNLDSYGLCLRGFDPQTGDVEDEPEKELETVLTLNLTVQSDLEPSWTLISDRAKAQNATRVYFESSDR